MCLVQIEGGPPKPAASCAMPAGDGMVVHTNTPMVKKAREGVMEFLLINHPLDCPICDQGGECDLQDQAMTYGKGCSRYDENKRAVKEKYMGPLIKTQMTRCIHCTRCVRFLDQVSGIHELGAVGRGEHMEISTYVEQSLTSELSGNIIDLCPVGALTSRPYAFKARPWELRKTETVDVMDAVGSNIRVDARGREVVRVLPRVNENINEEWISDKTRFACDGLKRQRLDRPYVRKKGKLVEASWQEAFDAISNKISKSSGEKIAAIAGDLVDCESVHTLKILMDSLKSPHTDCRQDGAAIDQSVRASYVFNTGIAGIEQADACLLIGVNTRIEAPLINARLRKSQLQSGLKVANIGHVFESGFEMDQLGESPSILNDILEGKHEFSKVLESAQKPMLIIGMQPLSRKDGDAILALSKKIADKYGCVQETFNGFNVLHRAAGRVGALDLGFVPGKSGKSTRDILKAAKSGKMDVVYLLGADEIDVTKLKDSFVIYQGHHGDAGAHHADVILPGCAYTEKDATYVNTEGRVQRAYAAVGAPGQAKEDWQIIAQLAAALNHELGFSSIEQVRKSMQKVASHFDTVGIATQNMWQNFGKEGDISDDEFIADIENFYMTDPISRASKIMAQCTKDIADAKSKSKEAA